MLDKFKRSVLETGVAVYLVIGAVSVVMAGVGGLSLFVDYREKIELEARKNDYPEKGFNFEEALLNSAEIAKTSKFEAYKSLDRFDGRNYAEAAECLETDCKVKPEGFDVLAEKYTYIKEAVADMNYEAITEVFRNPTVTGKHEYLVKKEGENFVNKVLAGVDKSDFYLYAANLKYSGEFVTPDQNKAIILYKNAAEFGNTVAFDQLIRHNLKYENYLEAERLAKLCESLSGCHQSVKSDYIRKYKIKDNSV